MSTGVPSKTVDLEYPDSDGEPMSDNTLQWDWMVKIVSELRVMYAGQNVFVAGDLLWYPVKGQPKTRLAPDGMVAFGRPPAQRATEAAQRKVETERLAKQRLMAKLRELGIDPEALLRSDAQGGP